MLRDKPRYDAFTAALHAVETTGGVVIVGPGGVGKSTLIGSLLEALHPDDTVHIAVDELAESKKAPAVLLDALNGRSLAEESTAAQIRGATEARRMAIVFDGADASVAEILDLAAAVPTRPNGPWIVIASRVRPMMTSVPVVPLPPFDVMTTDGMADAHDLFRKWYLDSGGSLSALGASPQAAREVLLATAGVPLTIRVAAGAAAAVGINAASELLSTASLDELTECIDRSVSLLTPTEAQLFESFGVTAGSFTAAAAAAVGGMSTAEATLALGGLVRHSLLDPVGDRFRMLPPIHRYVIAASGTDLERQHRHRTWCLALVEEATPEHDDDIRLAISRSTDDPASAAELTLRLAKALLGCQRHHRAVELLDDVLHHAALIEAMDTDDHVELLRLSAIAAMESAGTARAVPFLDAADTLVGSTTVPARTGARLASLRASLLHDAGNALAAVELSLTAIEAARQVGDDFNAIQSKLGSANMLQDLARFDEAEQLASKVIAGCGHDREWLAAQAWSTRAFIAVERGDRATCTAIAHRLLESASSLGTAVDAEFLLMLADPLAYAEHVSAAAEMQASPPGPWMVYLEAQVALSMMALVRGDHATAMTLASDIAVVAESLPLMWMRLEGLLLLGDAAMVCDELGQALSAYRQALDLARRHHHPARVADALDGLARLAPDSHTRSAALEHAALIRTSVGAARRPRPWLPALDTAQVRMTHTHTSNGDLLDEQVLDRFLAGAPILPATRTSRKAHPLDRLSPAERRVAQLAASGLTNREIGEQLHIARRTVETHLVHIFQKLSVHNRTQLAATVGASV